MQIEIVRFNPNWKVQFNNIKIELLSVLNDFNPVIEHIGSTSIDGMYAKPIIDILIGFNKIEDLDNSISQISKSGYEYYEKYNLIIPERRFYKRFSPDVHLHCVVFGMEFWNRHILFRDFLISNEKYKKMYADLKINLSKIKWENGNEYNKAKEPLILEIQSLALNYNQ